MLFYKNKTFWYISLAFTVFATDIYIYFHLNRDSFGHPHLSMDRSSSTSPALSNQSQVANVLKSRNKPTLFETSNTAQTQFITNDSETTLVAQLRRAESLTIAEVQQMKSTAIDLTQNQDLRFESVFLLAHNRLIPRMLRDIAETPIPSNLNESELDFEHIVRAQAIEGIELSQERDLAKQFIKGMIAKTGDSFLLDRLQKAHTSLTGQTSSSEVQDNQMLEKIIGN